MRLLAEGDTPSVADVAQAADVSRRTIYLYFPTFEQLLIDATLGLLSTAGVQPALEASEGEDDVEARLDRAIRAIQRASVDTEQLGRALIRLTITAEDPEGGTGRPPRGYRRIEWIESALDPVRGELDAARFERLVSSVALVTGWEALLVLRDVRGLGSTEIEDVSAWAACAMLRAALDEQRAQDRPGEGR